MIHGGYNTESKIMLDDFNLFDLDFKRWLKTRVIMNGQLIETGIVYGEKTIESSDSDTPKSQMIGARMGHCLATVSSSKESY